jgi:hypothetical protein
MPDPSSAISPQTFRSFGVVASVALALGLFGFASSAQAGTAHASRDVRVAGTCGSGATAGLRLKVDDGVIRIRFRVESNRRHSRWQVVIAREGRVVWRGRARSDGGGTLDITRRIRNLRGADQVTARALGPRGITCIAVATLQT